tara:strand:+ start:416 stop:1132 length:717 start_codon:yes stop_codon:yes gene_type:complete
MIVTENQIWDKLNTVKPSLIEAKWFEEVYSLELSIQLRFTIGERLGILAAKGWEVTKSLIEKFGFQPELIHAAGLCHQKEAYDFLLKLLREDKTHKLNIVKALSCWGALIPTPDLKNILKEKSIHIKLGGLNILRFKSHLLNAREILELVEDLLFDFREDVVIEVIRILQRRDEAKIVKCISKVAMNGTDRTVETALIALGAIGTEESVIALSSLSRNLTRRTHRQMAYKQISHQYKS